MSRSVTKDDLIRRRLKIFFSAAEVSGDKHAARLIHRMRGEMEELQFEGLGGDQMAAAGCVLMENLTSRSAMLTHAFKQVGFYWKLRARIRDHFDQNPPDLVIAIDSPAWNFHVAKAAKERGIPVLYYVAPQLWAWGAWRLAKLRRCVDAVACILPFEQEWFQQRNIPATFVGHPLFDQEFQVAQRPFRTDSATHFPTVALLPGSRKHEIETLWRPMQLVARTIKQRYPEARFVSAAPNQEFADLLKNQADADLMIDIQPRNIEATVRYADLTLVASGTATLEVAAQGCPMFVLYHVSFWQWHVLVPFLLKIPYISLVNILAGRELVPEFIPLAGRVPQVGRMALEVLADTERRQRMRADLLDLIRPLSERDAPSLVAEMAVNLLPHY